MQGISSVFCSTDIQGIRYIHDLLSVYTQMQSYFIFKPVIFYNLLKSSYFVLVSNVLDFGLGAGRVVHLHDGG